MDYFIREITMKDYVEVLSFWKKFEGLNVDESDSYDNFEIYLKRNPELCYIAIIGNKIVGAVKCGQDGVY